MKILVIDNNIHQNDGDRDSLIEWIRPHVNGRIFYVRRAPESDLPKSLTQPISYDKVIVSGSKTRAMEDAPWIEHLLELTRQAINTQKPYLGICYGHQILARSIGGKQTVQESTAPEIGWIEISLTDSSVLWRGLPQKFYSFSSHQDEVSQLPVGTRKIASSSICPIQALQVGELPLFGIQFHPEKKIQHSLYNPKIGNTILSNFILL